MKKFAIFGSVLLLHLSGCAFKSPEENNAQGSVGDPKEVKPFATHAPALETPVLGPWQGTVPCADCPGINYQLTLQKDRTYEESSEYLEKGTKPFLEKGTWLITQDSVVVLTKPVGQSQFRFSRGNLFMLDQQGQPITSTLAEKYRLSRPGAGNGKGSALETKRKQGIDFVAMGNNSAWILEVDLDKSITFSSPNEKIKLIGTEPSEQKLANGKATVFRAKSEAGTLTVRLTNQPCTDKKSGKQLPYSVVVTANAMDYNGCGKYLADENLNGSWALTGINGKPVNPEGLSKGAPTLQITLDSKQAAGNGGCNRYSGAVEAKGDQVIFGMMASTRMACPGAAMTLENDYLKLLSGNTFTYELEGPVLRLKTKEQTALVYRKAD
ncbi:copper resistance protein NlpE N-terminal domain-containing protein [Adhaeribacter sp. BT258]|uniref:Copper resistance protein NlpE N-terminal domain-containing protein n=1 Tax=Adhaeribacter terrigena TaxID=2793070 RepID=A0ABS1C6E1_9BACT|nr:copper resistance protein NlpE N-terminal domain-containing protein [Adhaeribacter terrigena]MBK0404934.1 copper resistance protein NlpE N-terminal domain-containing protein [Adhaeribacter terrigena]